MVRLIGIDSDAVQLQEHARTWVVRRCVTLQTSDPSVFLARSYDFTLSILYCTRVLNHTLPCLITVISRQ